MGRDYDKNNFFGNLKQAHTEIGNETYAFEVQI